MKKTFLSLSALTIAVALTTSFTACSNEDLTVESAVQPAEQTFTLCIPATLDNGTRAVSFNDGDAKGGKPTNNVTFTEKEKVAVYNVTKKIVYSRALKPSDISEDGKHCNLNGTLNEDIDQGDELKLYYNLSRANVAYKYSSQDGTEEKVLDACEATVTVGGYKDKKLTTTTTATLQPLQSVFRFQFVDENGEPIFVKSLAIKSKNNALVGSYDPLKDTYEEQNVCANYDINLAAVSDDYIYLAIRIDKGRSDGDVLKFVVTDEDGNIYRCTKKAPKGGFQNGKYYYNSSAIKLTKETQHVAPTVEWTTVKDGNAVTPEEYSYDVYGPVVNDSYGTSEITLSGNCTNYWFKMLSDATIHLNGLTATCDGENQFINSDYNVTLDINGDNTIVCEDTQVAVNANNLRLRGDGTLTVRVKCYGLECGIYGKDNYNHTHGNQYTTTDEIDMTAKLAASGYTVTRGERKETEYGTYTWTYTVKSE